MGAQTFDSSLIDISASGACIAAVSGIKTKSEFVVIFPDGTEAPGRAAWVANGQIGVSFPDMRLEEDKIVAMSEENRRAA
jgi:hypothetical protein